ncbi:DUF4862 family protein [Georgenia muralis]|uniref:Uncharacterized protein DUF4862 n=1 Tax=Georgenia muralis TaxID=154117 RepID=A0A3N5A6D5_9MICO|nr:DUF4862 family protein [Georgenia muralis]RPF28955.1 uncharacterized protein DUF4862 [Georgenia muralis]
MTHEDVRPLLGAYAMAPTAPAEEAAFYDGVAGLDVGGLELPLPLPGAPSLEPAWFDRNVRPGWDLLVTCVPTVMGRLATDPGYGLAATDDDARARALEDVARARDLALRLADTHGRRRVVAVQVHSAPGPDGGSRDALARSLEVLAGWDLAGARLLLEHCDAASGDHVAVKGFLTLEEELAALRAVGAGDVGVGGDGNRDAADVGPGLSINWGRSAIEGRGAATPVEHVRAAADAGLLGAVVLSGATGEATAWGEAWGDAHIPPRGDDPALAPSSASLLGPEEVRETLDAAGPDALVAVKISVRPTDADVPTRLAVAGAALTLVDDARRDAR